MLNTIALMGRITHDLELNKLDSGKRVMRFCLAVNRNRASKGKEKAVDFIDCISWGNTAEFINTYFKRGDPIIIDGRLETNQYEDKQGNKKKSVYVVINKVNFCAFKKKEESQEKSQENNINDLLNNQDLPF